MKTTRSITLFLIIFLISVSTTFSTGCFEDDSFDDSYKRVHMTDMNAERLGNRITVTFNLYNGNDENVKVKYEISHQGMSQITNSHIVSASNTELITESYTSEIIGETKVQLLDVRWA